VTVLRTVGGRVRIWQFSVLGNRGQNAVWQIWECGRMSHEQHGSLQHTSAKELFVVHLCKKMEVRCFSFMESTVTVRGSGGKKVQHDPPFFCACDKPSLFFGLKRTCWQIAKLLRNPCCSAHLLRRVCANLAFGYCCRACFLLHICCSMTKTASYWWKSKIPCVVGLRGAFRRRTARAAHRFSIRMDAADKQRMSTERVS